MGTPSWEEVAQRVRAHRTISLAKVEPTIPDVPSPLPNDVVTLPAKLLSPRENEITTTKAEDLVISLATGRLSSIEVMRAFLRRARLAQKLVIMPLVSGLGLY